MQFQLKIVIFFNTKTYTEHSDTEFILYFLKCRVMFDMFYFNEKKKQFDMILSDLFFRIQIQMTCLFFFIYVWIVTNFFYLN